MFKPRNHLLVFTTKFGPQIAVVSFNRENGRRKKTISQETVIHDIKVHDKFKIASILFSRSRVRGRKKWKTYRDNGN